MTYETFKEAVADKFMDYLTEQYKDMEMEISSVNKVNCKKDGITLFGERKGVTYSPTIYINDMYDYYKSCGDLTEALQNGAISMMKAVETCRDMKVFPKLMKENIVFQIINTEHNEEMLAGMPHREFLDLSIIYRCVIKMDEEGTQSTLIDNGMAEWFGFTEEQLFKLAMENTKRIFPPYVKTINDVMRGILMKDGMPQEIAEMLVEGMPSDQMMWILSNGIDTYGAVSMLYEDELFALASKLESDLYILPSSIHEVIVVKATLQEPDELAQMVAEANMGSVALEERLSNQVYYYDRELRKLSLATDM